MDTDPQLKMPTGIPSAKLIAAQLAVFCVPILWYFVSAHTPVPLPENAQSAIDALFQSLVVSLIGLGAGYMKRPAQRDVPVAEVTAPAPSAATLPAPPPAGADPLTHAEYQLDAADAAIREETIRRPQP